ncbi:MAG: hypothetical protein HOV79_20280 [Hamadaea sp.]|nr:hypothetical protein [Hamadaea sp.]
MPRMMAGDASGDVRRWKLVALTSTFVAVAAVAGLTGWVARGPGDATPTAVATFTGGGWVGACSGRDNPGLALGTAVKILSADGAELASGKIVGGLVWMNGGCRQEFIVDGIPGGRGVYLAEVERWRHTVSEAALRGNTAEILRM